LENPEVGLDEKKKRLLTVILVCIERLKSHTSVITSHNFVPLLFQTIQHVEIEDQMIIFSVLLEQCADKERNCAVLDGIRHYMFACTEQFNTLLNELSTGCHLPFKIRFLELVNATINAAIVLGKLDGLRDDYYEHGLSAQNFECLGNEFPDDELIIQIRLYISETGVDQNYTTTSETRKGLEKFKLAFEAEQNITKKLNNQVEELEKFKDQQRKIIAEMKKQVEELKRGKTEKKIR